MSRKYHGFVQPCCGLDNLNIYFVDVFFGVYGEHFSSYNCLQGNLVSI